MELMSGVGVPPLPPYAPFPPFVPAPPQPHQAPLPPQPPQAPQPPLPLQPPLPPPPVAGLPGVLPGVSGMPGIVSASGLVSAVPPVVSAMPGMVSAVASTMAGALPTFPGEVGGCGIYDLRQTGDVFTDPAAKCSTLPAILGGSLPRLSSDQSDAIHRAKKYAMEQSIKMVLMKQTLAHQQQQMATQRTQVQRQQALALMCRVYVGSISFELKEDTIRQAFLPFGPIKSINMSWDPVTQKHKGFAFVEYEIPEAAQLSLEQMNGVMLGGRNIKVVGRPSNMPQAQAVIDEIQEEAKRYNRIYVASIHTELTEDDIKNVFEAFGPITYCKLAYGASHHRHKGYGFIEYGTLSAALEAIASMNLFDLGGQYLRVGRAITPPNALAVPVGPSTGALPTAAAVAAAAATAKIQAMDAVATNAVALGLCLPPPPVAVLIPPTAPPGLLIPPTAAPGLSTAPPLPPPETALSHSAQSQSALAQSALAQSALTQSALSQKLLDAEPDTLQQQESLSISGQSARHLVMQRLMRRRVSHTVLLTDMVSPEDVDEALHHEIQEECAKYGRVQRLVIYNERQHDDDPPHAANVKIFVQFHEPEEANAAMSALNGRYFGGRTVRAALYDQDLFDHGDLSQ